MKKNHYTVWHKKQGRFISSSALKPHSSSPDQSIEKNVTDDSKDRKIVFLKDLSMKIRRAVRGEA